MGNADLEKSLTRNEDSPIEQFEVLPPAGADEDDLHGIKKQKSHSFLDEADLSKERLPRQIFDLLCEGGPNMATMLGVFYYSFINMLFARQIGGSIYIASYGMGITWFNAVSYSVQISLNAGLVIQLAQAFGAKNYKRMQDLYQRCQGILLTISLVSILILLNTKTILMGCGISEDVAILTEELSISQIPQIFATILLESTRQLLIAQNIFGWPMRVQVFIYFVHPFWCFLFTQVIDGGLTGLGIARCFSDGLGFILLSKIIRKYNLCPTIWEFKYNFKTMFSEWMPFLRIAVPTGCVNFLEWIFFEIQTILVGMLNDESALAGQSAFNSISMFFFMAPLGLSWTANSYLGNAIGEGKKKQCLNLSKIIQASGLVLVAAFIMIGVLLRDTFYGILVTDDVMGEDFLVVYDTYLYIVVFGQFLQVLLNGVLRCSDLQNFAAMSYFIVYYVIGIPLTVFLTLYTDLRLRGAWIGMSITALAICVLFYWKIAKIDWDFSISTIRSRMQVKSSEVTGFENLIQH